VNVFIFGGSFDPPHVAHVLAVTYILATQDADLVLVVPCHKHPFGKGLSAFEHRFAMCERAVGWLPRTTVSRVEEDLGGESRTLRTIEHLRERNPDWHMRLVVGADVLLEGKRWYGFDRVVELAPLLVLGRAGVKADGQVSGRTSPADGASPSSRARTGPSGSARSSTASAGSSSRSSPSS
jgi:nicotinate-nucleotide adenylyltransferase